VPSPALTVVAAGTIRRTTHATIAIANLESQIAGIERLGQGRALTVQERASLADLRLHRGQVLGRISDYEAVVAIGESLVRELPRDGRSWLVRARAAATLHLFQNALVDLAEAEHLGMKSSETDGIRASILQATGRYDEALAIRQRFVTARPDIVTIGSEAIVRGARGELDEADRLFTAALASYRDVSPFPVAWIDFQRGLMWMREDQLERAQRSLKAAYDRLPQYAQATGHLAEVEAALGHTDVAIALLEPLAASAEDPDYAAQLARILGEAGRTEQARPWRERAAARYDEVMARHPEAYADHAAEFWLAAGADPGRALTYAERNLALRPTVRAWELVLRAARAKGDGTRACAAANGAREAGYLYASARTLVDEVLQKCPACEG
jgi:tetratricopeptide (TPR) repeat protein